MEKTILLVDDTISQKDVLNDLIKNIRRSEGINVIGHFVNPNNRNFWNDNKDPDIDKLTAGIAFKFTDSIADLIIIDQYYSDLTFNGLDLISKLRNIPKFKNSEIFLYSGKRDVIVKEIFNNQSLSDAMKVANLAKLINLRISQFLDKDFRSEALRSLKKVKLDNILPGKLRNVEEGKIQSFSPRYREIPMGQLADMIESNDMDSGNILSEIFDLTIAHYVKLNEGLQ
ncbi:hypothetical protein [Algoriphagus litoralis]|uniref:hypothetical protein n=1 Tax=Algoriphagus litoralis TaxID=2202829 RepID=UPI000DB91102|nr:hypothetical protein [Algoriphagus litoralis]